MRLSVLKWRKKSAGIWLSEQCLPETEESQCKLEWGIKRVKKYSEKPALGKSAGPDDILGRVLKELAGVIT